MATPSTTHAKSTTHAHRPSTKSGVGANSSSSQQQHKKTPTTTAHRHRISLEDDHEIYLQLMAGENKPVTEKTANQLQLEERARLLDRRAKDPAVTDPECAPGPVDFECAERAERSSAGILVGAGVGVGNGGGGGRGGGVRGKGR